MRQALCGKVVLHGRGLRGGIRAGVAGKRFLGLEGGRAVWDADWVRRKDWPQRDAEMEEKGRRG